MPYPILISILAILGAVPIIFCLAAVKCILFKDAKILMFKFLDDWAMLAPESLLRYAKQLLGYTGAIAILAVFTMFLDRLGNVTIHHVAAAFSNFNKPLVQWSYDHTTDWKNFRRAFQTKLEAENKKWDDFKNDAKWEVRAARIMFLYCCLMSIAGIADFCHRKERRLTRRGVTLLTIGLLGSLACVVLWTERKEQYMHEVLRRNAIFYLPVPMPQSLPAQFNLTENPAK